MIYRSHGVLSAIIKSFRHLILHELAWQLSKSVLVFVFDPKSAAKNSFVTSFGCIQALRQYTFRSLLNLAHPHSDLLLHNFDLSQVCFNKLKTRIHAVSDLLIESL